MSADNVNYNIVGKYRCKTDKRWGINTDSGLTYKLLNCVGCD